MKTALKGFSQHISAIADLVAPRLCCVCGASCGNETICPNCMVAMAAQVAKQYCPRCGGGLGENLPVEESGCAECPTPAPRFQALVRLGPFDGALAAAISALKFNGRVACAKPLGHMLAQAVAARSFSVRPEIVCPIPLHWRRRIARGYNQADLLASDVASTLKVPLGHELIRTRNTPPQMGLSRDARKRNIKGAFAAVSPKRIAGLSVLLVDDVTTTGATADEAARSLLKAGCARVILAVAAKAERRPSEPKPR